MNPDLLVTVAFSVDAVLMVGVALLARAYDREPAAAAPDQRAPETEQTRPATPAVERESQSSYSTGAR